MIVNDIVSIHRLLTVYELDT